MDLSSDDDLRAPLILDAEKGIGLNTYLEMMGYLKHQLKLEVYIGKLGTE
jgi:hypothetical protein